MLFDQVTEAIFGLLTRCRCPPLGLLAQDNLIDCAQRGEIFIQETEATQLSVQGPWLALITVRVLDPSLDHEELHAAAEAKGATGHERGALSGDAEKFLGHELLVGKNVEYTLLLR